MRSTLIRLSATLAIVIAQPTLAQTVLPTWSEQIAIREGWLVKRHQMLLPMMRKHGVDMWIIVNEEFHDDPLTQLIAPPRPYTGNRDIFVFVDAGAEGLKSFSITCYSEDNLKRFFETWDEPRPPATVLAELYTTYQPKHIRPRTGG